VRHIRRGVHEPLLFTVGAWLPLKREKLCSVGTATGELTELHMNDRAKPGSAGVEAADRAHFAFPLYKRQKFQIWLSLLTS